MNEINSVTEYREEFVTNVMDILNILKEYPDLKFFRGQSKSNWTLKPKIARIFEKKEERDTWDRILYGLLGDFQDYSIPYLDKEPDSNFHWLVLGQHYGLPTNLLDWTTNPLKATFFAVNESMKN